MLQASFVFLRHCFVKLETIRRENKVHLGICRCNVSGCRKHMINYFKLLARLKVGRLSVCQSLYLIFLIFWILAVIVCHWNLAIKPLNLIIMICVPVVNKWLPLLIDFKKVTTFWGCLGLFVMNKKDKRLTQWKKQN